MAVLAVATLKNELVNAKLDINIETTRNLDKPLASRCLNSINLSPDSKLLNSLLDFNSSGELLVYEFKNP